MTEILMARLDDIGEYAAIKVNLTATSDPTVNDDAASGYAIGSRWFNGTADKEFVCLDATVGAAVWKDTTAGAAGGISNVVEDTTPQLGGNLDTQTFTVDGRDVGTDGTKLDGIETAADVTDATNVAAAGALMTDGSAEMSGDVVFSEKADHGSTPTAGKGYLWVKNTSPSTIIFTDDTGADTTLGSGGGGLNNIVEDTTPQLGGNLDTQTFTVDGRDVSADGSKLDGIETGADVTDAANVAAAGALFNIVEDTTPQLGGNLDAQSFTVDGRDVSVDGTKLDGIETGADVTDAANVASAGALMTDGSTEMSGDLVFAEKADHGSTPAAGKGYIWVKNTAPSTLIFTDDTGVDTTVGSGGGGISNVVEDTTPQLGGELDGNGFDIMLHETSVTAPALRFQASGNTGIYRASADGDIGISIGGTMMLAADGGQQGVKFGRDILARDGSAADPSNSFDNDQDTGLYSAAANQIGVAVGGAEAAIFSNLGIKISGGDISMIERADHANTPAAGEGYIWVKNTVPTSLIFTDDTGADTTLGAAGGGISNVVEDTTPQLGGHLDVNGQVIGDGTRELLTFVEDASAVNHLQVENQATGSGPILRSTGDDTNVDLVIETKGTGSIQLGDTVTNRFIAKDYAHETDTPSISSGTLTLNYENGPDFDVILDANVTTITLSNWPASGNLGRMTVQLTQDATGSRTVAFPAGWNWPGGTAPTITSAANATDAIVVWTRDAGTTVYAATVGQNFS